MNLRKEVLTSTRIMLGACFSNPFGFHAIFFVNVGDPINEVFCFNCYNLFIGITRPFPPFRSMLSYTKVNSSCKVLIQTLKNSLLFNKRPQDEQVFGFSTFLKHLVWKYYPKQEKYFTKLWVCTLSPHFSVISALVRVKNTSRVQNMQDLSHRFVFFLVFGVLSMSCALGI